MLNFTEGTCDMALNDPHTVVKLLRAMATADMFKDHRPILDAAMELLQERIMFTPASVALAALKPFASYAAQQAAAWDQHDASAYYGVKRPGAHQITYGDFRRAAAVMSGAAMTDEQVSQRAAVATLVYEAIRWAQHGANEGMISTTEAAPQPGDKTISSQAGGTDVIDQDPAEFLMNFWDATGRVTEFEETAQVVKDMILKGEI